MLDVLKASQEGAVHESVRITCLTNAKERLDILKSSNNIIVDWFLGQILKRNGNYNASKSNLIAIMENIGPHLEHRPFTLERSAHYNIHDESVIKSVYRVRFDLSTTLLMTRDWNKAVAVLEPLCTKGSGYVGRAMALMLRASTLSQIDGGKVFPLCVCTSHRIHGVHDMYDMIDTWRIFLFFNFFTDNIHFFFLFLFHLPFFISPFFFSSIFY